MKRIPQLRALSEDHHHGLVLAQKARRAGSGEAGLVAGDVWIEVEMHFHAELAPHFLIEEPLIAPWLHRALRECLRAGSGRTPADLYRFGELLEDHIRFEERELFETAQRVLTPEALGAVADACRAPRP
jgi:hypothetical protein